LILDIDWFHLSYFHFFGLVLCPNWCLHVYGWKGTSGV